MENQLELQEFANSINFEKASQILSDKMGYYINLKAEYSVLKNRISFESNELIKHAGIFFYGFDSLKLCNFGGGTIKKNEDGCLSVWFGLNFTYSHPSGGTNGTNIGTIIYTQYKGFEINLLK